MSAKKQLIDYISENIPEIDMIWIRSKIDDIQRQAVEDELNDVGGAERFIRERLDSFEKCSLFTVGTDTVRALFDCYRIEKEEKEPVEIEWINYIGKLVKDPDGDEGCITGYSYEGFVNLCVNGIWWGERSLKCSPVVSNDVDQIEMF